MSAGSTTGELTFCLKEASADPGWLLGGVAPAENSPGGGPLGGGQLGGQLASASPSASPAAGRLGTAGATTARRGASFDLGRGFDRLSLDGGGGADQGYFPPR